MVHALLLCCTLTGDVTFVMDLTKNMWIPVEQMVMEPQFHPVGWERLKMLNLTALLSGDVVADLLTGKIIFAN